MKIYHGGELPVVHPVAAFASAGRSTDFGTGFYATTSSDQALRWVRYKIGHKIYKTGCVSEYEVSDDILSNQDLKVLQFASPSREWLRFVVANRRNPERDHGYDLVFGPVANDKVFATIALFEDGIIDEEMTIARLKPMVLIDQFLFHTQRSIDCLRYAGSEAVDG